jgi:alpha/beta superfamily hydrolase
MTMPKPPERRSIDGPAGAIQTAIDDPGGIGEFYAIVCHPHPLFGGTMDNKVVTTLTRAFRECAIPSVRFNFRGVGASAGTHDEGRGEALDAEAVDIWAADRWPGRRLIAAGFSFGAYVAARLAERRRAARLILVAPPVGRCNFGMLAEPACPWFVVQGDADEVVDPQEVMEWFRGLGASGPSPPRLAVLPGVGHFFHGRLNELRDLVIDEFRSD